MRFYRSLPDRYKVAINSNHPVVDNIFKEDAEEVRLMLAKQALDLVILFQGLLTGKELTAFVKWSGDLI